MAKVSEASSSRSDVNCLVFHCVLVHSGLADRWASILKGLCAIALGSRSAVVRAVLGINESTVKLE